MPAEELKAGTAMQWASRKHWTCVDESMSKDVEKRMEHFPEKLAFGSMCSGSGMDKGALLAVQEALHECGVSTSFVNSFMAENDQKKQNWLLKVDSEMMGQEEPHCAACLFDDVTDLKNVQAPCHAHGRPKSTSSKSKIDKSTLKQCRVPDVNIVSTGSSCKYFSAANQSRKHGEKTTLLSRQEGDHQSLVTYQAFILYLQQHGPDMFLYENTDGILDSPGATQQEEDKVRTNVDVVVRDTTDRGYEVQPVILKASGFGTTQKRRRFFVVGLRRMSRLFEITSNDDFDNIFERFIGFLKKFKMAAPEFAEMMLEDDDPAVQHALKPKASKETEQEPSKEPQWSKHHRDYCKLHFVRYALLTPLPDVASSPWWSRLTFRDQDVLKMSHHFLGEFCCVDYSQSFAGHGNGSHGRVVMSEQDCLPTMMPTQNWWIRRKLSSGRLINRPLVGVEGLMMQAFPIHRLDLSEQEDRTMMNLAGNAFNGLCIVALLDSIFMSIPWRRQPTPRHALMSKAMGILKAKPAD